MRKLIQVLSVSSVLLSVNAVAGHNHFYDYGRVIDAEPVYEYVQHQTTVRHCYPNKRKYRHGHHGHRHYSNYRHYSNHDSATPTIVGAIIGGAIGNAIGHNKTNKKIGLAAGAVLGGAIGHDIGKSYRHRHGSSRYNERHYGHHSYGQQCSVSYEDGPSVRELTGYKVTYKYKGERFHTFTKHHPGHKIRIQVNVTPAGHGY